VYLFAQVESTDWKAVAVVIGAIGTAISTVIGTILAVLLKKSNADKKELAEAKKGREKATTDLYNYLKDRIELLEDLLKERQEAYTVQSVELRMALVEIAELRGPHNKKDRAP